MGNLLARINAETEQRTLGGVPWRPWASPWFGGRNSFGIGGPSHPMRALADQDGVLGLAAVYSATRFISDQIASLGIKTYRRNGDGTSTRIFGTGLLGDDVAGGGPQADGTLYDWLFSGSAACLLNGTSFGLITNRSAIPSAAYPDGLPTGIAWLAPERMHVVDDEVCPEDTRRARVYYNGRLMDRGQLVMLKAYSLPGRLAGISPVKAFSLLFNQGISALQFSSSWLEHGGFPPGTFQNVNEEVDDQQAKEVKRRLDDAIRSRSPLVYGRDWDYKPLTVPADEATFIRSMQLNASQVAAIYGVQPYRCGGTRNDGMAYSNQTQNTLDEISTTLRPWLVRWEHLLTSLLPSTQYATFDVSALLRTDPKTQSEIHQTQRNIGERTTNEIRAEADLPPVQGGDDSIPLSVLTGMMRSTRAIPKSYMPLLDLEPDRIAALLERLQAEDLTVPDTGQPVKLTSEAYLAQQITARKAELAKAEQLLAELRARPALPDSEDGDSDG